MSFSRCRYVHLVLLRLMRVTFGDDRGSVSDSLVGELVRGNDKVDGLGAGSTRRWCESDVSLLHTHCAGNFVSITQNVIVTKRNSHHALDTFSAMSTS